VTPVDAGLAPANEVIGAALAASRGAGCVVLVEDSSDAELRFANNTTTTNGVRRSRTVTVVGIAEVQGGVAAGSATRSGVVDVADLVRAAEDTAASAPAAEDASALLEGTADRGCDEPAPETDLSALATVLGGLPGAFERAGRSGTVLAGFVEHGVKTTYLGTSTGIRRRHVQQTGSLELTGRADGGARAAWAKVGTADFAGVTLEQLEEDLARRLQWASRRVDLPAGRYEVVLPPGAVAEFMADLYGYASAGQDAEDGTTVFSRSGGGTRVGDRLSALAFELRSDPMEPGIECMPFLATGASSASTSVFDNGLAFERTRWIADGHLAALRYHRAGAMRSGVAAAGLIDNLVLELPGATRSVDDLVATTERGLLLNSLFYIRMVDPRTLLLTGLTRDGVYLVENGTVTGAVNNFRFNESPVDLLARATEAGASIRTIGRESGEYLNRTKAPPLRIPDFNMSSVSPAS
jgi:predicted Zn-dependent protease